MIVRQCDEKSVLLTARLPRIECLQREVSVFIAGLYRKKSRSGVAGLGRKRVCQPLLGLYASSLQYPVAKEESISHTQLNSRFLIELMHVTGGVAHHQPAWPTIQA